MVELILGTYGLGCWLIFKKFKLIKMTTYTIGTAVLGGIFILFGLLIVLSICHPCSHDGRLYSTVVPIVPQVRGKLIDVPVQTNTPLREGELLFRIDPRPYQYEVDRLEGALASINAKVAQLDAKYATAKAATEVARSNLLVSESDFDRQARITLESATAQIEQTSSRLKLANDTLERTKKLRTSGAVSAQDLDRDQARFDVLEAELLQAQNSESASKEKLKSGTDRVKAMREELKRTESQEREARIALDAESNGMNPEVRQTKAELDRKRFDLEQATVRAPTEGYVTFNGLRPGQMVTPFSSQNAMLFVPKEKQFLVASFPQGAVANFEPGLEAEIAFMSLPGQIFPAKVFRVLPITAEGQFMNTGSVQATPSGAGNGNILVQFEYGDDVEALNLPSGAQASIAVYTKKLHAISLVRKVILRIKSWENYAFFMKHLDAVH